MSFTYSMPLILKIAHSWTSNFEKPNLYIPFNHIPYIYIIFHITNNNIYMS